MEVLQTVNHCNRFSLIHYLFSPEPTQVKLLQCLPDTTSLFLNWTLPEGDIETYDVAVKRFPREGFQQFIQSLAVSRTEATLPELTSNATYEINVSAVGSNGMRGPPVTVLCNTSVEGM